MEPMRFFAGGNTAEGFFSCFEDAPPRGLSGRRYYLKGGPGVGKSTLMRRVGQRAEALGLPTVYYHCASDPDSLDGVAIPSKGVSLWDGTAPHVYDPALPGARDTLLSLGDLLDERALRPHVKDIEQKHREISERFRRCYGYLGAAQAIRRAAACGKENAVKADRVAAQWCEALPRRGGEGQVTRLFASAITPKGLRDLGDTHPAETLLSLECPFGLRASGLMRAVARRAAASGLDATLLLDPLEPREVVRVLIPAHGLCFRAEEKSGAGDWLPAQNVFDMRAASESEQSYDRNAFELMLQRAAEQLRAAKSGHDELEAFYVKAMDFGRWEETLARVLSEIFEEAEE